LQTGQLKSVGTSPENEPDDGDWALTVPCPLCFGPIEVIIRTAPPLPGEALVVIGAEVDRPHICHTPKAA
jgi:hypothetical protein